MREEGGSMEVAKSNFEETSHEKARDARLSSDGDPEGRKLTDSLLQEGERATDDHKQGMDARFQHTSAEVNHGRWSTRDVEPQSKDTGKEVSELVVFNYEVTGV